MRGGGCSFSTLLDGGRGEDKAGQLSLCIPDRFFTIFHYNFRLYPYKKILLDFYLRLEYSQCMFTETPTTQSENSFLNLLRDLQSSSPGLSDEETFALLGLDKEDFDADQLKQMIAAMLRGRALAKKRVMDNMFQHMSARGGEKLCVDYMRRFAEEWPADAEYSTSEGGSFTVNLG